MNGDELSQVLRMVSEGKVSVPEAQELIGALQLPPPLDYDPQPASSQRAAQSHKLVIGVSEDGEMISETVIPLALLNANRQFVPRQLRHYLSKFEVDLDTLLREASTLGLNGTLADLREDSTNLWISLK
jgi:hypothetical protein